MNENHGIKIKVPNKPGTVLKIGKDVNAINVYVDKKFNKLQKFMWEFLLGIEVIDND